jgi:hypothetical protein
MKHRKRSAILLFLILILLLFINVYIAYAKNTDEPASNDPVAVAIANGYDLQILQPTKFSNLEQTGENILKIWGGPYLNVDDRIIFAYHNNTTESVGAVYDYFLEVEIDGQWYQLLKYNHKYAVAFRVSFGKNYLFAVDKNICPQLFSGKHRVVLDGWLNKYCEFEIIESDNNPLQKPQNYDIRFLDFSSEYHRDLIERIGINIIKISNPPITTTDECINYEIGIIDKDATYWEYLYFETKIEGQWYVLAMYVSDISDRNKYTVGYPIPISTSFVNSILTLTEVELHKVWEPAGPFAGEHRLWGNLVLEDGSKVLAYGEFEIVEAAKAAHAGASAWAQETVRSAISAGLVPLSLQGNYQQSITRAELAALSLAYLESATGLSTEELLRKKSLVVEEGIFSDTDDAQVLAAYTLGIVEGMGNGTFNPNSSISREQLATMLTRTLAVLDGNIKPSMASTYADRNLFSAWAVSSIDYVTEHKIMNGVGANRFDANGNCTREQAIITFYRVVTGQGKCKRCQSKIEWGALSPAGRMEK